MAREITYNEYAPKVLEIISKGAFLTTNAGGRTNTMTIGWGGINFIWGKPIFMVMVRPSRFSFGLIEQSGEFTVTIPLKDLKDALNLCGSKSGRDIDKISAAGLMLQPGKTISTPVIAGGGLHYECKIVYKQAMIPTALDGTHQTKFYGQGDYHTMYFGEILTAYIDE